MTLRKLPVTIVTGFLGSGKTTLMRHILQHAEGRRIAVIVNEFGELGIDGEILKGCGIGCDDADGAQGEATGQLYELANGCLCCTVQEEFYPVTFASRTLGNPSGKCGTTLASSDSVVSAELRITMSAGCWSIRTTPCVSSTKPPGVVRSRCIVRYACCGSAAHAASNARCSAAASRSSPISTKRLARVSPSCQRRSK